MRIKKTLLLFIAILAIFVAGCGKDNDVDGPTNCVVLTQGEWEFKLEQNGSGLLTFVGELHQDGCRVWQAYGGFFDGSLEGTFWSGTNTDEEFSFEGNFTGSSYDEFTGTLKFTSENTTYDLLGYSVK